MEKKRKKRIPKRLGREPLIEAVWELRFEGDPASGGALPGMLFEKLKAQGENASIEALALSSMPRNLRDAQEPFRYAPTSVLRFKNFAIFIGDRCAALSVVRPYPGWSVYEKAILTLADWLRHSGLLKNVEQSSIKYLDFFSCKPEEVFRMLRAGVQLGGLRLKGGGLQLQAGVERDGFEGMIRIANPATVLIEGELRQGLLTDIQFGWKVLKSRDFWAAFQEDLRKSKTLCHELFFELLTEETLKAHKPVYED